MYILTVEWSLSRANLVVRMARFFYNIISVYIYMYVCLSVRHTVIFYVNLNLRNYTNECNISQRSTYIVRIYSSACTGIDQVVPCVVSSYNLSLQ